MSTKLPTLSNENQLKIMGLVKAGMSIDEAIEQAMFLEKQEKEVRQGLRLDTWLSRLGFMPYSTSTLLDNHFILWPNHRTFLKLRHFISSYLN